MSCTFFARSILALLLSFLAGASALALDPARALTQSRLSVWTSESGLPQNTIDAMVQTRDGYLWIGTEEGLVRFDGVRFVVSDRQNAPGLRSSFVSSLFEGPDGTLWIGTYGGGLARLRNGRIEAFHPEVLGADRIREMHAMADGAIFAATAGGGLLRIDGERVTRFTTRDGLPTDRIWALEADGQGGLWVATHGGGVVRWQGSKVRQRLTTREGLPNDFARALLRDADGTLWIGTDGGGVVAWRDGAIVRRVTTRDGLPNDFVRTLLRDRDGGVWVGTDLGLARLRDARASAGANAGANAGADASPNAGPDPAQGKSAGAPDVDTAGSSSTNRTRTAPPVPGLSPWPDADAMGVDEGLPSAIIRATIEDREGSLWIGTTGGLVRLSDTRVLPLTRKEGLPVDTVRPILEDRAGSVWVGTEGGGLCRVRPVPMQCFTRRDGLPHDTVYTLAEGRDGSLWVGTDGGGVARLRDGRFVETIDTRVGLPNDRVRALVETTAGHLWISTSAGLALRRDGQMIRVKEMDDRQLRPLLLLPDGELLVGTDGAGLWQVRADGSGATLVAKAGGGLENDRVFSLTPDAAGGGVWIGTSGGGLGRLDLASGSVRSLTRRDGLYDDVVFQVVDAGADLWLTSNRGVHRVPRDRVLAAMAGKKTDLSGTVYGTTDGMPSAEGVGAFPGAIRARDGHVWVATARGVAVIDPEAGIRNPVPPPVQMEEVLIDGTRAPAGPLRVQAGAQRLEIRYTALSLRAPERVKFRYLLEGYDRDWVDAGATRIAHYTKLAPGDYTFRVTATNEDGVASNREARLAVTVDPRWFETWWARLLGLVLIAAAIRAAVRLRLAASRARKNEELARAYEDVRRMAGELEETNRQFAVANVRLRALSYVDGLTGVANRRRFDEALEEVCSQGEPVALVLLDLDHFKLLNDTQGHQEGDEALRAVAAVLTAQTESRGGLAARFGGEEFAWLLPGLTLDAALAEAETLRLEVRAAAISHPTTDGGIVTASLGVAASDGTASLTALVAAADAALYRAKSRGRDRVESEGMNSAAAS